MHIIQANIETEIAPIVGSEEQAKDLIDYISQNAKESQVKLQDTIQKVVNDSNGGLVCIII